MVSKKQAAHQISVQKRDYLRMEMNKYQGKHKRFHDVTIFINNLLDMYRQKQELVEQQIMEIDKHNSIINKLEKDMIKLKKEFELSVNHRNRIGDKFI